MEIKTLYPLAKHNTFGVDATAKLYTEIHTTEDIRRIIKTDEFKENKRFILGGGSNVLFVNDFNGLVIKNCIKGIKIVEENDNEALVEAGGGEVWDDLVQFAVKRKLGGIENLSLIPGTVGAAPIQNIGAYGTELVDVFTHLLAIDMYDGSENLYKKEDCNFGYRDSIFKRGLKDKMFITHVYLKLSKKPEVNITYRELQKRFEDVDKSELTVKDISDAVIDIRRSKLPDPEVLGNSGSFFKNPIISRDMFFKLKKKYPDIVSFQLSRSEFKIPAGWLIEKCGFKGKKEGNTGTHKNQALVIVNHGGATGKEVYSFAQKIKGKVFNSFGIELETEVNIIQ